MTLQQSVFLMHWGITSMINGNALALVVEEIIEDMNCGACLRTVTQTAQVLDLGDGRKAAVRITVTTDEDSFM